jgi:hypothetical protein
MPEAPLFPDPDCPDFELLSASLAGWMQIFKKVISPVAI